MNFECNSRFCCNIFENIFKYNTFIKASLYLVKGNVTSKHPVMLIIVNKRSRNFQFKNFETKGIIIELLKYCVVKMSHISNNNQNWKRLNLWKLQRFFYTNTFGDEGEFAALGTGGFLFCVLLWCFQGQDFKKIFFRLYISFQFCFSFEMIRHSRRREGSIYFTGLFFTF